MKATRLYGNHDVYSDWPRDIVKPSVDTKLVADSSEDQAKARAKQIKDIQERENTDKALAWLMPELLKADTNNKFDLLFVSEKKTAPTLEEEYKVTQKIQIPLWPTPEHLVADLEANSRADALTRVSAQEAQDKKDQSKPYTVIAGDTLSGIAAKYEERLLLHSWRWILG